MGPLTVEFIGSNLSLIIALVLGIAFGFVLESAGFSSSRKLVGLFYGYDFVVLRVFFTAGITAMAGLVIMSYLGWINPDLLYINPTFLAPAIVGGLIMGVGFVMGGFCPGTSVCAASVGKIGAFVFIAGIFVGVGIFVEGFSVFKGFYLSGSMGSPFIYNTLGISKGLFGFLLILMAVVAFVVTTVVERKVRGEKAETYPRFNPRYAAIAGLAIIIGFIIIFMPDSKARAMEKVRNDEAFLRELDIPAVNADELAVSIIQRKLATVLIDVRPAEELD